VASLQHQGLLGGEGERQAPITCQGAHVVLLLWLAVH
jgi:hypothetical protein